MVSIDLQCHTTVGDLHVPACRSVYIGTRMCNLCHWFQAFVNEFLSLWVEAQLGIVLRMGCVFRGMNWCFGYVIGFVCANVFVMFCLQV